jgi:trigger factor
MRRTVKMDGFRPGKVPLNVVKKQYGSQVHQEVIGEEVQRTFFETVEKEKLDVAGYPRFDELDEKDNRVSYIAYFEIYPEITLPEFSVIKVEKVVAEVTDADVEDMITKLREQRQAWKPANGNKKAKAGDQVIMDFVGKLDGVEFEGGKAENVPLELGSGRMIPGFEDGIIGMKKGEEKVINVTFPDDYQAENLKGQAVTFDITVHSVQAKQLPEIDEEFVKSFGIEDGQEATLRAEIKGNMKKELSRAVDNKNRTTVLEALGQTVDTALPKALINQEVDQLMQRAIQKLQEEGLSPEQVNLTTEQFEEEGIMRVKLGLILGDVIKAKNLEASDALVTAYIEEQASSYEDPSEVVAWYQANPKAMAEVKSIVIEKMISEAILAEAQVTEVTKAFSDVVNNAA